MLFGSLFGFICILQGFAAAAQAQPPSLPPHEVEALEVIGRTVGKDYWNISLDPCSGLRGWHTTVTCDCSFNMNTTCHVLTINLPYYQLNGTLPAELTQLAFLQEINFYTNNLSGGIPSEWGSMKLKRISLFGNRITGSVPKQLANITTLEFLNLEGNQLSGSIPPELGFLPRIQTLIFTSNYLTGEIPTTLANLSTLKDFRISDNYFTGQIPIFIQNWTNVEKVVMQASGLTGPIPPQIFSLTKLIDLRISDLYGNNRTAFPPLYNLRRPEIIILRSCNIEGNFPSYIGIIDPLQVLDLSFNQLSGGLPAELEWGYVPPYLYLTGNSLTGTLPDWVLHEEESRIDLSYNNLTSEDSDMDCQMFRTNLFASSKGHTSGRVSCLRGNDCREGGYTSVHINCGGGRVDVNGTTYEDDTGVGGASNFSPSKSNWGFSSTGHFMSDSNQSGIGSYTSSVSEAEVSIYSDLRLSPASIYNDVRVSPVSLTYYAYCLINGTYIVTLHFAETLFLDAQRGRRLFDVYIQGKLVLKDFNIEKEAGGVGKGIKRNFTIIVDDTTLDIRFYWAGRGTIGIPRWYIGYGSIISAISVDPDFTPSENAHQIFAMESGNKLSKAAIAGIVLAVLLTVFLFLAMLWWKYCIGSNDTTLRGLKDLDVQVGSFTLKQIQLATNNFDPANKIGEGGFGSVYKGHLPDGTIIAVKQLSSKSTQGNREFVNEIGMISAVQHPHLVKLYGCSVEGNQLLLVYEYMENNSLARALFGPKEQQLHLDWPIRQKISIGIARGLAYLHGESRIKIVHRDIKATNVLLDKNLVPKISDFGLAKLHEVDNSHISTRIAGTLGYMAPEYATRGYLTDKADVYSFGVVLLEIISGRSNIVMKPDGDSCCLLDWVDSLKEKGNLLELVDPRLGPNFDKNEVMLTINVAILCTNTAAIKRPSMPVVVSMLEGKRSVMNALAELGISPQHDNESHELDHVSLL